MSRTPPPGCPLGLSFGSNVANGTCAPNATLPYGGFCQVECAPGYDPTPSSVPFYNCSSSGTVLTGNASMTCVPRCTVPLPNHTGTSTCSPLGDNTIQYNTSCTFSCAAGYEAPLGTTLAYECGDSGALTTVANATCIKSMCLFCHRFGELHARVSCSKSSPPSLLPSAATFPPRDQRTC